MTDDIPVVTEDELADYGFCRSIMSSPRTPGKPVKIRYSDSLVVRDADGRISVCVGYFTEEQRAFRQWFHSRLSEAFSKTLLAQLQAARNE